MLLRREREKTAELLVLRHENTVLRRRLASPVRYEPADRFWFAALSGTRLYALVFLEHGTRRLPITDVTTRPTCDWTVQQARNLAADLGTRMEPLRFLLRDRDSKYGKAF